MKGALLEDRAERQAEQIRHARLRQEKLSICDRRLANGTLGYLSLSQ